MVERAFIIPPLGQIGPLSQQERQQLMQSSLVAGVYDTAADRESAYELLKARAAKTVQHQAPQGSASADGLGGILGDLLGGGGTGSRQREGVVEALAKSAARSVGNQLGRALIRGVMGSLFGGRGR